LLFKKENLDFADRRSRMCGGIILRNDSRLPPGERGDFNLGVLRKGKGKKWESHSERDCQTKIKGTQK